MGQELPFRDAELSRNPDSEVSFYNKLKIIIDILQNDYKSNHKMNTFRIHGGEVPGTENNILHTLTMLKELAPLSPLGFIPPPEIRIGHAVHFVDTPEYFDLLRKFGVIVEINATSNKNISSNKKVKIQIEISKENRTIRITDNGIGMTKEDLENNLEGFSYAVKSVMKNAKNAYPVLTENKNIVIILNE